MARQTLAEELIDELAEHGTTVLLTTHDIAGFEGLVTDVAILDRGTVVLDEPLETLKTRFRRLRYARTADATQDGTTPEDAELADLESLRVRRRGSDIDAVVARFDPAAEAALRAHPAVTDLEIAEMSLEEVFVAVTRRTGEEVAP